MRYNDIEYKVRRGRGRIVDGMTTTYAISVSDFNFDKQAI